MALFSSFIQRERKLEEFAKRVELGEMICAYHKVEDGIVGCGCENTATHVKTIEREFSLHREVLDVALCDEHKDWIF